MIVIAYFASPITRESSICKFDDRNAEKIGTKPLIHGMHVLADVAAFQGPTSSVWIVPGTYTEGR